MKRGYATQHENPGKGNPRPFPVAISLDKIAHLPNHLNVIKSETLHMGEFLLTSVKVYAA